MENKNNQNSPKVTKEQIASANDLFRQTLFRSSSHRIVMTNGVSTCPDREKIISAVRAFSVFTEDNDPHGEHDFGSVEINREKFFWKIDYYDSKFEFGGDPYEGLVARILTIMRADEY